MSFPSQVTVHITNAADFELLQKFITTNRLSCSYNELKSDAYKTTSGNRYKPSKDTKEFWGSEFLSPQGFLSEVDAIRRLTLYGHQYNLLLSNGITLDNTLHRIFNTSQTEIQWNDLKKYLAAI